MARLTERSEFVNIYFIEIPCISFSHRFVGFGFHMNLPTLAFLDGVHVPTLTFDCRPFSPLSSSHRWIINVSDEIQVQHEDDDNLISHEINV